MSHQKHGRRILPHDLKYPMFFLGLLVIIGGGLGGIKMGLGTFQDVGIAVVGFLIMLLGIVLE